MIKFDLSHTKSISVSQLDSMASRAEKAWQTLWDGSGEGNDFLGWRDAPAAYDTEEYRRLKSTACRIRNDSDVLLVLGIGGSYLGARACIELLKTSYHNELEGCKVYFLGNSFCGSELQTVIKLCEGKRVSVNVISKSGTTTETSVAFRFLRRYMSERYTPEEANRRIIATTDSSDGALHELASKMGWESFVIPDDVGGRFSVLTPVGLLPMAVAGIDIDALMEGARLEREALLKEGVRSDACRYAAFRNAMLENGKTVELAVSYDTDFRFFGEWFKQLFGESEGKEHKGLFPACAIYSTDLHSLGQFVQDGSRILFETLFQWEKDDPDSPKVPFEPQNGDGLNFLAGMSMDGINSRASVGTMLAHSDGGTDTCIVCFSEKSEKTLGALIYFLFVSCAVSGYILGVNPFDQPGVEGYKKNMFALLGKPGYEEQLEELTKKIKSI